MDRLRRREGEEYVHRHVIPRAELPRYVEKKTPTTAGLLVAYYRVPRRRRHARGWRLQHDTSAVGQKATEEGNPEARPEEAEGTVASVVAAAVGLLTTVSASAHSLAIG